MTTVLIKLLFFNLSAISYKSLGHMKKLQPRLDLLKEQYKDNKKEFSQAILELYKKERVNPLSGCLPILIQIPVFISLYYVLLESIELRHAPFIFWIKDLSAKDSYYILPIIMCLTMFVQQKLNPPIQDPFQQKVMMFMPFVFLLVFLQFPSGLVLYWIINNILSIIQQWIITKNI
jgi:YidC/Oxa1 family membrane protein insertase